MNGAGSLCADKETTSEPLEDQVARYTREGASPRAGRTLEQKTNEANEFLDQEQRGVGVSVYQDKVLLSKGYGLSQSCNPSSNVTSRTLFPCP
ncbi:hypothetical protein PF005_g29612 [Phytophthora fragariae]|uniref:Uncharacterized protein n=1 Tax=Phytophthora fragariae TaxID=53985 RepID=A0A6A3VEQ6_9STRA|nr:hypothetical protein PF007_g10815 [Phytophthora fragariae]KAE9165427.1 hypothetical protein PF005_g29612 [Phytophthora fragariae]KAE9174988.1 hypothetical protein PF004_g26513 [Phytophthora fragariae]KAE9178406.1 hypothetical protein PF002_g28077 [Phytophthora fragariae]